MGGYESSYYGYLWSEVYAQDLYDTIFGPDPFDPKAGMRYRKTVLARGGSQDAKDFLREILGREPSSTPFLKSKGLAVHTPTVSGE